MGLLLTGLASTQVEQACDHADPEDPPGNHLNVVLPCSWVQRSAWEAQ